MAWALGVGAHHQWWVRRCNTWQRRLHRGSFSPQWWPSQHQSSSCSWTSTSRNSRSSDLWGAGLEWCGAWSFESRSKTSGRRRKETPGWWGCCCRRRRPAAGPAGVPSQHPAGVLKWLAAESLEGRKFGEEVIEVVVARVKGNKHVQDLGGGRFIFCECVHGAELETFLQKPGKCDRRLIVQKKNNLGQPERSLQEVAQESEEVPVAWILPGPRTSRWCINYLAVEGLGFEGHHERLRQICKVDGTAWGIAEHFQTSMALRQALLVDQLNGCNLLSVEIQFRRLQTIEFSYAEKAREAENRSMPGKLSIEEQSSFGGVTRQFSTLMICPSLLEHVKTETEKEAVLQKSLRKAREEREAAKKASAGKKKSGGDEA